MAYQDPKKKFYIFLFLVIGLIIFWIALGFFLFFHKTPASIYVYPENPKQGDTVFIRVKSQADNVIGKFNEENLDFLLFNVVYNFLFLMNWTFI